jgi:predicted PurR-regulated permease PerM
MQPTSPEDRRLRHLTDPDLRQEPPSVVRRITWRKEDVVHVMLVATGFVVLWQFFWMVINALFLGLLAVLVAMFLNAPAKFLARWMPFRAAFPLTLVVVFGAGAGLVVVIVPQILNQVGQLAQELPAALESVVDWLEEGPLGDWGGLEGVPELLGAQVPEFTGRFLPFAMDLVTGLVASIAVLILAVFLAAQPEVYRNLMLRMVPVHSRERAAEVYDTAGRSLRRWVIGKGITMLAVGIVTYIGLTLFGIPGALALAALAAILEFIPNFGPILAWIPAVIAAFLVSPLTALYVTIFYIVLQQVQSALTVPLVERKAVNIPPPPSSSGRSCSPSPSGSWGSSSPPRRSR